MLTLHKGVCLLGEGSVRCTVTAACDFRLYIELISDPSVLNEAAGVFCFTFDKLVQLTGKRQHLVNAVSGCVLSKLTVGSKGCFISVH